MFSLLIVTMLGCREKSIKWSIATYADKHCAVDSGCLINLDSITNFSWDTVFIFNSGTILETINKVLGFDYPYFDDIACRIIFVKNKNIVYHDDEFPDPDKLPIAGGSFNVEKYYKASSRNASFYVKKEKRGKSLFYDLTPSK